MKEIIVRDILKSNVAISKDDGDIVFNQIKTEIENKNSILIDFKNIDLINTAFLNNAIGKIYFIPIEKRMDTTVRIVNFPLEVMELLEEVINTAKEKASITEDA
ncbi:STAS-like domain-containing protein [Clostridium manihotivorum]|uniref:DUF4325 domain-containing protein n=1 Tax=Clostridium manihotivorum TaxID=2320868 RepID=A0A3R5QSJ1_9CLOT|nr:DUF4325 domain-containing protein [Clostridium manihotivorum]QAA31335.1 hypothetical protein C1I91_06580 [Clostridium manihotivorum]